jgi:hypothetical protein
MSNFRKAVFPCGYPGGLDRIRILSRDLGLVSPLAGGNGYS